MNNNLSNEIRNILLKLLKIDNKNIPLIIDTESAENWDSLNHLMIIEEISKKYNIKIPTSDSINLLSEKEIINYLETKIKWQE
ncbi:MAG: hypothetical protein CMM49_05925 [Rhodospirillaceae bacterium]|nr:hypothetical protein [Rhodospirillaceae bacterium]